MVYTHDKSRVVIGICVAKVYTHTRISVLSQQGITEQSFGNKTNITLLKFERSEIDTLQITIISASQ